jgi:MATE family multidrug resistance protein
LWCYIFISKLGLREYGAAIATNITFILNLIICDIWIKLEKKKYGKQWFAFNSDSFKDLGGFLQVGIPGALMLCFEWWAFELLALFSGYMGTEYIASEVIVINITSFMFMIPLGVSYSAASLIGLYLGEKKVHLSKRFAYLTMIFNLIIVGIICILLSVYRKNISEIFTKEPQVNAVILDVMGILIFYIFFDSIHGVQSGIIRGLGLQGQGSIFTLVCYYILGMPLALHFAFKKAMYIKGLWLGFSIACVVLDVGFAVIIGWPSWQKIADKFHQSLEKEREDACESLADTKSPISVIHGRKVIKDLNL